MKKISTFIAFSSGLLIFIILAGWRPTQPVTAAGPTPTPTMVVSGPISQPLQPCRLELGLDCDFRRLTEMIQRRSGPRYNPATGAREAPTHTLISTTFDSDMNPATINAETFYVRQGTVPLNGTTAYLRASRMAVFYPDAPLMPNTTYTVTMTTDVRTLSGQALPQARQWHFTTAAQDSSFGQTLNALAPAAVTDSMKVYFGDLHSHTGYSGGVGTPTEAFAGARAGGLDFFALTEHDYLLTEAEWAEVLDLAQATTVEGEFIGLRGFEYTNPAGHINVFETDTFISANDPNYDEFTEIYGWLTARPAAIGQFNHPQINLNFNNFAYAPEVDLKVTLREITTPEQFFLSLDAGWHVGSLLNTDTHIADWGCCRRMGLIAPNLTKPDILAAIKAGRTFYVPPNDPNFALVMQANGYWMGSATPNPTTLNFTITAYDPDPGGASLKINLYERNVRLASAVLPSSSVYTWSPTVPAKLGAYYFVEAYYDDWWIPAYSSPIWVEQPPIAKAGPAQVVAPGAMVSLDGRGSNDPDGDALAYHWVQESGSSIALSNTETSQPTFIAPDGEGEVILHLTVVDPGNLSGTDTTTVTITNKPVLAIAKDGPTTAEPGELITYTLTVTNNGLTDASNVVITDAVPAGANYISGGTLLPGNIVAWTVPHLPAQGGMLQVTLVVTTNQSVTNAVYGATCPDCIPASGQRPVITNARQLYLPIIIK